MSMRRLLVLLKPFNVYPTKLADGSSPIRNPQVLRHLESRSKTHETAVKFCEDILRQKSLDWTSVLRNNLSKRIQDVDMVISIGGDGTLLQASHFMDESIPVLGVNSDPTQPGEVEAYRNQFDASRSTGYLCAATVRNFEQVLDDILEERKKPHELSRIGIKIDNKMLQTYALNDVLMSHPCPASTSRFSFEIVTDGEPISPLVNCRSSGLRVSTATGSTAAMFSAGGFIMPVSSRDLQYMVREPILSGSSSNSSLIHELIKSGKSMKGTWYSEEGMIYIDGSHVIHSIQQGDVFEISSKAPHLKVYLPKHFLS